MFYTDLGDRLAQLQRGGGGAGGGVAGQPALQVGRVGQRQGEHGLLEGEAVADTGRHEARGGGGGGGHEGLGGVEGHPAPHRQPAHLQPAQLAWAQLLGARGRGLARPRHRGGRGRHKGGVGGGHYHGVV